MKYLITLLALVFMTACAGPTSSQPQQGLSNVQGGVDVGNMRSSEVPATNASMSYEKTWLPASSTTALFIENDGGSKIEAKKAEITDLSSPTAVSIQQYLKAKYPNRRYDIVNFNGFEGVRADLENTADARKSDLYLVSELKDFIHIQSDLKKANNGIVEGEAIIRSVRVKYRGVAIVNAPVKTVTLQSRTEKGPQDLYAYSFSADCFTYVRPCKSSSVGSSYESEFRIGTSGYSHGRVVELGPESQIPFDSIRIEGAYLVAPMSNTPISDIYTAFSPKDLKADQNAVKLKKGYIYLIRTINWPDEDLITKMRVEDLDEGVSAKITYQRLVEVSSADLQQQVDLINKNTIEREMPLSLGEVTLYNRTVWNNYFYSAFNFRYSTSGNMFITYNSWDLMVESGGRDDSLEFSVPHTGSAIGDVIDLGVKDVNLVTAADMPNPNTFKLNHRSTVIKGHTYAIYHYNFGDLNASRIYGAVEVLDVDSKGAWARLKFKRIEVGAADAFQSWIGLPVPSQPIAVALEFNTGDQSKSVFYPFVGKRGDAGSHYYERIFFDGKTLDVDPRPYHLKRGFYVLPRGTSFEVVSLANIESVKSQLASRTALQVGDVIAVHLENYYDKTVLVLRVDGYLPGQGVQMTARYLQRAKTAYSDD